MLDNWTTGRALRGYVDSLDPVADDEEITANVSNVLFADAFFAHSVYLVTFARQSAIPAIARVLYRSGNGDIAVDPVRRNNDTIIFFTEFYRRGYKSEDGRAAIRRMEDIHERFIISEELKLYTLATILFEPDRLAKQFGHDPFSAVDREARWNFWCGLGREMGLTIPVETREDFHDWMVAYEQANYANSVDSTGIFECLVQDWLRWYPSWVPNREWLARQSLTALLAPELRIAMGVDPPSAAMQAQVNLVAAAYLKSTPYRIFRKNRTLRNYFGKQRATPEDLETVGYEPPRRRGGGKTG